MTRHPLRRGFRVASVLFLLTATALAQAVTRPPVTFVQDVHLGRERTEANKKSLLLRDGEILEIFEAGTPPPLGVRLVDGRNLLCLPAFLDAYATRGCETPEPVADQDIPVDVQSDVRVDMRQANRKGIQPSFHAADALVLEDDLREDWRAAGFGAALVSPAGQLLAGVSALVTTRDAAARDCIVDPAVFLHGAFQASGPGYPSTLMGYIAQLRQFFLDVAHQEVLVQRYEQGRRGPRPPHDEELEAGRDLLTRKSTLLCEAETSRDVERWLRLGEEFGLRLAFVGGRDAWRVADTLAERALPVILTLDWGKEVPEPKTDEDEPESEALAAETSEEGAGSEESPAEAEKDVEEAVWTYTEPMGVRLERRREWENGRDCALRLAEAGVPFAFGSRDRKPAKLLEAIRTLIEVGLPAETAERALTTEAARILGVEDRLGRVAKGYDATFVLWDEDPLTEKKARPVWMFVDGYPIEFEPPDEESELEGPPDEGVDASGTWELEFHGSEGIEEATLILEMSEDGTLEGTLSVVSPMDQKTVEAPIEGQVSGSRLVFEATLSFGQFSMDLGFSGELDGDLLEGETSFQGPWMDEPESREFTGHRKPQ